MKRCKSMIKTANEFISLCSSAEQGDSDLSMSEEAPIEVWNELIDLHPLSLIDIAQNRTIPSEIISKLSVTGDATVRAIIAEKRRLPVHLFPMLASDADEIVRRRIACNAKTPIELVRHLMSDAVRDVADVATYNFNARFKSSS